LRAFCDSKRAKQSLHLHLMSSHNTKVAVIGGGAAGFFAAISCKHHNPSAEVVILERSAKTLAKVKVSGGGRCNVTNATYSISELSKNYPRGEKQLKKAFSQFMTTDTVDWFESRGVELVTQEDKCIFPKAQDSQVIIDCLMNEISKLGITIKLQTHIEQIKPTEKQYMLSIKGQDNAIYDKVIIASGGQPKLSGLQWLADLGHKIEPPVPSLFTFNMPKNPVTELMGVVVNPASVKIPGTKLQDDGPLLITHWGMSGPAILKLSAWGARVLEEKNYQFNILVNWLNEKNEDTVRASLDKTIIDLGGKMIKNTNPFGLPNRLWIFLLSKYEINTELRWSELGKKGKNKMVQLLYIDEYQVSGKTTFKEEFVTCGGVSLSDINFKTMESKVCSGMYFAGELLDIDGITGGFNFQAAWTTGFIAGKLGSQ
jgi:predicted Rossmann fold flavoprotein